MVIVLPGERALLDPLLLLPLSLLVFLHPDLPDPSDQGQVVDRDVQPPLQAHGCSWTEEEEEEQEESFTKQAQTRLRSRPSGTLNQVLVLAQALTLDPDSALTLTLDQSLTPVLTLWLLRGADQNRSICFDRKKPAAQLVLASAMLRC